MYEVQCLKLQNIKFENNEVMECFFFLKLLRIQDHPCSCNLLYNMRLFILLTIRINSKCAITVIVNVKFNLTHTCRNK